MLLYNLCQENNRGFGTKFFKPLVCTNSERRGRYCVVFHRKHWFGRSGTLAYNSFWWRAIRLFNSWKAPTDLKNRNVQYFILIFSVILVIGTEDK